LLHVIHYGIHLTDRLHESDIKTHSEQEQNSLRASHNNYIRTCYINIIRSHVSFFWFHWSTKLQHK